VKGKDMNAEVFFLSDVFLVQGAKIQKLSNGKLVNSKPEEIQKQILAHRGKETKIDFDALEDLKKIFGDFELVC
jgi:hypothetical protein